jgi:hypothetical protein
MRDKTQILLEQAYKTVLETNLSTSIQGPHQGEYKMTKAGTATSTYNVSDPRMTHRLSPEGKTEVQSILDRYVQKEIEADEVARLFEDLLKKEGIPEPQTKRNVLTGTAIKPGLNPFVKK